MLEAHAEDAGNILCMVSDHGRSFHVWGAAMILIPALSVQEFGASSAVRILRVNDASVVEANAVSFVKANAVNDVEYSSVPDAVWLEKGETAGWRVVYAGERCGKS